MRVKLTDDLRKYDSRCTVGSEGMTGAALSMWAQHLDHFTGVYFDSGARLDVAWQSLEIIDEEYLAQRAAEDDEIARTAQNVTLYVGPRGGFRYLHYEYSRGSVSEGSRSTADRIMALLNERGIAIRTEAEQARRQA